MHYTKFQKTAVGSVFQHVDRGIDVPEHNHSNENIDPTRTPLNYDLKDRGEKTAYQYFKEQYDEIATETKERTGKALRKDAVVLGSWVLTAPKDLPENKQQDFFKSAYKWFSDRYGEQNIVAGAVHLDETTPHIHLQFLPIVEKNGMRKLCAKERETKYTLKNAHNALQKHLTQELGVEVHLINGATEGKNKSILELQVASKKKELDELTQRANSYKLDGKKKPLETKKNFEERQALHAKAQQLAEQQALLVREREQLEQEYKKKQMMLEQEFEDKQEILKRNFAQEREQFKQDCAQIEEEMMQKWEDAENAKQNAEKILNDAKKRAYEIDLNTANIDIAVTLRLQKMQQNDPNFGLNQQFANYFASHRHEIPQIEHQPEPKKETAKPIKKPKIKNKGDFER